MSNAVRGKKVLARAIFPGPQDQFFESPLLPPCAHHRAQGIMFGKASSMFGAAKQGMGMGGGGGMGMGIGGGGGGVGGGGGGGGGLALSNEEMKEAFREFDLDKNGYVGAAEIAHILQSMGEKATDDEVDEMILMADLDGDGQVSFEEFFKLISSFQGLPPPANVGAGGMGGMGAWAGNNKAVAWVGVGWAHHPPRAIPWRTWSRFKKMHGLNNEALKKIYKQFLAVDTDKSGMVDINEFTRLLRVERSPFVERLFSMFDSDKTGLIDLKEFVVGLSKRRDGGEREQGEICLPGVRPWPMDRLHRQGRVAKDRQGDEHDE